ncbi:thiamine-monophosphate kinase [Mariprofundus micogutta]|uniref:Thiamine-monophosphate kinase n=1 Tax=Mariprofundus micogutta TaxID=1921010 RepID=A0A1L8CN39_9PROT|nr:thiamine-phosphate kinase [Mariprofundus micogutta]GAV20313.1 thiamine-monophosphate kinase [Mariprofundus micogutta]
MSDNEFSLIDKHFKGKGGHSHPFTRLAIGDDASVHGLKDGMELVVSTDSSVENVHWPHDMSLDLAADRSVCAALSDLAAMGAEAIAVWVNVMAKDKHAVKAMAKGVSRSLRRYNVELVGGDTCRSATNALSVTVAGQLPAGTAMCRNTALADDNVWLAGRVGFHALGLKQWMSGDKHGEFVHHINEITPRLAAGVHLREMGVRCCLDVSDGLLQDARHLADASGVGMDIEVTQVPEWLHLCHQVAGCEPAFEAVVHGGEDYALLFTAPASMVIPNALAVKIGTCRAGTGVHLYRDGVLCSVKKQGYLHFE